MKHGFIRFLLLFFLLIFSNIFLRDYIEKKVLQINCFFYQTAYENLRNEEVTEDVINLFLKASDYDIARFSEYLAMYFASNLQETNIDTLEQNIAYAKQYQPEDFEKIRNYINAIWSDAHIFPVGAIKNQVRASVSFDNSWQQSRNYGGERLHEGTDIMASVNKRGLYPIYSVSEGVVENIGWLKLGGYRIGIRSTSGVYFYYAHLAEYASDFEIGDEVLTGTLLGFMGDTGYSEIEGTTGNFDVHLHFGIYLEQGNEEFSVNPYPILRYLHSN